MRKLLSSPFYFFFFLSQLRKLHEVVVVFSQQNRQNSGFFFSHQKHSSLFSQSLLQLRRLLSPNCVQLRLRRKKSRSQQTFRPHSHIYTHSTVLPFPLGMKAGSLQKMKKKYIQISLLQNQPEQNSHIENPNFHKIHPSEISIFTKFTFLKSQFPQNSHF